jgi:hypothetical protein
LLQEYFKVIIVIGAKSLKAPFLNVNIDLPLEVVPSGNMANGKT